MSAEHLLTAIILMSPAHDVEHQIKIASKHSIKNNETYTPSNLEKKFYRQIFMLK